MHRICIFMFAWYFLRFFHLHSLSPNCDSLQSLVTKPPKSWHFQAMTNIPIPSLMATLTTSGSPLALMPNAWFCCFFTPLVFRGRARELSSLFLSARPENLSRLCHQLTHRRHEERRRGRISSFRKSPKKTERCYAKSCVISFGTTLIHWQWSEWVRHKWGQKF